MKQKKTQLIRIAASDHALLRTLAAKAQMTQQEVVTAALQQYRRKRFLHALNDAYAQLQASPDDLRAWKEETGLWDATVQDVVTPPKARRRSRKATA